MREEPEKRILLTGATGFVGRALYPELRRAGYAVRCLTRDPERAWRRWPEREWVGGDVADQEAVRAALEGCDAAYYLVHGMAEGAADFHTREVETARTFLRAAEASRLRRIVYLGGIAPEGRASEHLQSRLDVGEVLRGGGVSTVELRASMIVGHGSLSWLMVRDLAARLPGMVLPRWLRSRTQPVALADVLVALVRALELALEGSDSFDIPGPETLSGREILERTAAQLGLQAPVMVEVPVLSPWLSSHWVHFVTRAEWSVAREVVVGLQRDMLARDDRYWARVGHPDRMSFDEAARLALAAERAEPPPNGFWGGVERWVARVHPRRAGAGWQ